MATTGEKIQKAREALGRKWTQQRLADEMKKHGSQRSRAWIANIETNRILSIDLSDIMAIGKALNIDFKELLGDPPKNNSEKLLPAGYAGEEVVLPKTMWEEIHETAESMDRTIDDTIRVLLKKALAQVEEKNKKEKGSEFKLSMGGLNYVPPKPLPQLQLGKEKGKSGDSPKKDANDK